jgi:hypothetical protein
LSIPGGYPGDLITGGPLPFISHLHTDFLFWELESLIGPNAPVVGAMVGLTTGVFTWQTKPTTPRGFYTATIRGTSIGTSGTDTGLLTFEILVPEPGSLTLLGIAVIGFARQRRLRPVTTPLHFAAQQ